MHMQPSLFSIKGIAVFVLSSEANKVSESKILHENVFVSVYDRGAPSHCTNRPFK